MLNHSLVIYNRQVFSKECQRINRIKISFYWVTSLSCSRQKLLLTKSTCVTQQKKIQNSKVQKPLHALSVLIVNYNNSKVRKLSSL